jgi:hypothetical protein
VMTMWRWGWIMAVVWWRRSFTWRWGRAHSGSGRTHSWGWRRDHSRRPVGFVIALRWRRRLRDVEQVNIGSFKVFVERPRLVGYGLVDLIR